MTRLAVAAAMFASALVGYTTHGPAVDTPTIAAPRHRPTILRASRSYRRDPLLPASTRRLLPGKARRRHASSTHVLRREQTHRWTLLAVTAYCATGSRNAAGHWPTIGTAAANAYPLGTRLDVQGVGVVTVEDRSAPGATDVDIYLGAGPKCAAAATNFGRRALRVAAVS